MDIMLMEMKKTPQNLKIHSLGDSEMEERVISELHTIDFMPPSVAQNRSRGSRYCIILIDPMIPK